MLAEAWWNDATAFAGTKPAALNPITRMRPEELESIYRTAPVGLAVLDPGLRFVRVNERMAEMNGLPAEAHIGRTVRDVLPDLADQAQSVLLRVLQTGQPVHDLEVRGQTRSRPGVERVWLEHITPLRNEQGEINRLSIVAEEITERRRSEASLLHSQQSLELAMEAAGQAMWDRDLATGAIRFSGNWRQILGFDPGETITMTVGWIGLMAPEDRPQVERALAAHLQGRTPAFECEYRIRHADGRWVWLASRGRVVARTPDGQPLRMIGVMRDVTAQHDDREQLQRLARLLELAFDAIIVWSGEQGIEFWNHGAELQYGYTAEEARGKRPNQLLQTRFPGGEAEKIAALQHEGVWRGELSHQTKDGRRIPVTAVMQRVANGTDRILEITRDISKAKAFEAQLLERERALTRSQERLQVALAAGQMGVWDWVPASQEAFWSPEVFKLLGLDATPGGTGPDPVQFLQMVHPDDRAGLDATLARVLAQGGDYEAEFRVARADGEIRWLVSRGRVLHDTQGRRSRLVGVNFDITDRKLIERAMKEADTRRTEFLAMLAHDDWLSITVQDDGPGVSPELQPKIFDLFTQDKRTLDRSQGGLGIGLALVKRLAELHGGRVRCESGGAVPGARFVVCLPRQGRREQLRCSAAGAVPIQMPPLPMLVVDDNADAADTLAALLRFDGHRVEVARDGEQAVAAAFAHRPRVVLLDFGLPKLDGLTVARRLRADKRFQRTVLIATSGYAQAADREATAEAGLDGHLAKPVELLDLYRLIEEKL